MSDPLSITYRFRFDEGETTVRISQDREATTGRLAESVELFSRRDGKETPFMRMAEEGIVYRPAVP